jgi:hypothetical protein
MPKQKIDSEIVKARNRARSHFRRESKAYEERSLAEAREALNRARYRATLNKDEVNRQASIASWVTSMSIPVLASLDITPEMDVNVMDDPRMVANGITASGWTDFSKIHVRVSDKFYNENDPAQLSRLIALTKGLIYHEAGHILYTIPYPQLVQRASEAGYKLSPLPGSLLGPTGSITIQDEYEYKWVWNLLEDQRMECAVVRTSPIIERYYRIVVLDAVIRSIPAEQAHRAWPFITGRSYLPLSVLNDYRRKAVQYAHDNDLVDALVAIDQGVRDYKRAKTEVDMVKAVEKVTPALRLWLKQERANGGGDGGSVDDHGHQRRREPGRISPDSSATESGEGWGIPTPPTKADDRQDDDNNQGGGEVTDSTSDTQRYDSAPSQGETDEESDNETSNNKSDGKGQQADGQDDTTDDDTDESDESDEPGTGVGAYGDNAPILDGIEQTGLNDLLDDLIDNVVTNDQIHDLVTQVNDSLRRGVPRDPSLSPMPTELLAQVEEVRAGMLNTLAPLAVQADPAWRFRQESGVFDPVTFMYREPGDTDYWVDLDDTGATGHDLAVSVILDVSYSMSENTDALSVGALGIRMACDELDIPCTVSTFSDNGYLYFDATDKTEPLRVSAHGGTEPTEALEDLPNQRYGKARHLVVVFTDGAWSHSAPMFSQVREPGMYILGVGFGLGVAEAIAQRKPDVAVKIESVSQLPAEVTKALIGYLV